LEAASNCHSRLICGEEWCDSGSILDGLVIEASAEDCG
jgi:hypothetical protein